MSFADTVDASRKHAGGKCPIGLILLDAEPKWAADVVAVLADRRRSAAAIKRALALPENGTHLIARGAVERHRNQDCSCVK